MQLGIAIESDNQMLHLNLHYAQYIISVWAHSGVLKDLEVNKNKKKTGDGTAPPPTLPLTWLTRSIIIWTTGLIITVCLLPGTHWAALWMLFGILSSTALPTTSVYAHIQPAFLWVLNYQLPPVIYGNLLPHYCLPPQGQRNFLPTLAYYSSPVLNKEFLSHCERCSLLFLMQLLGFKVTAWFMRPVEL